MNHNKGYWSSVSTNMSYKNKELDSVSSQSSEIVKRWTIYTALCICMMRHNNQGPEEVETEQLTTLKNFYTLLNKLRIHVFP